MGSLTFTTTLVSRGPGVAVILDESQVAEIGAGAKRFPAVATINGESWRSSVVRMRGEFMIGLSKAVRAQVGAQAGDTVQVTVALDTAERTVAVPDELARALAGDAEAAAAYERLAYTHRKEFARWVGEAKQEPTRLRRATQALEMLHTGRTRS